MITDLHLKYGLFYFSMLAWFIVIQNLFQECFFSTELLNLFLINLYLPQGKLHFSLKRIWRTKAHKTSFLSHFVVVSNEIVQNHLTFFGNFMDKVNLQENNVEFCMQLLLYHQTNSVTISTMLFDRRTCCMVGVVFFVSMLLL